MPFTLAFLTLPAVIAVIVLVRAVVVFVVAVFFFFFLYRNFAIRTDVLQISPKPGFVVKTKLVDTGMKVFVNVCQHERIGESNMVKKLDKDGQEVRDRLSVFDLPAVSPSSFLNCCHRRSRSPPIAAVVRK